MRILSILALSAMALTATAQSYTVTGKIDAKYNGKTVYLTEQVNVVDSAVVENGAFKFERKADDQTLIKITMQNNKRMKADIAAAPGAAIAVDFTTNPAYITDNGGLNDKLNEINNAVAVAGNAVNAKIQELQQQGMPVSEIQAAVGADIEAIYDIYRKAIEDNKDNMVGAFVQTHLPYCPCYPR